MVRHITTRAVADGPSAMSMTLCVALKWSIRQEITHRLTVAARNRNAQCEIDLRKDFYSAKIPSIQLFGHTRKSGHHAVLPTLKGVCEFLVDHLIGVPVINTDAKVGN